jgi:hypothetical protein
LRRMNSLLDGKARVCNANSCTSPKASLRIFTNHPMTPPMPGPEFAARWALWRTGDGLGVWPGATEAGRQGRGFRGF